MGHAYLKAGDGPCRLVASCAPRQVGEEVVSQTFRDASQRLVEKPAPVAPARRAASAKAATVVKAVAAVKKAAKTTKPR